MELFVDGVERRLFEAIEERAVRFNDDHAVRRRIHVHEEVRVDFIDFDPQRGIGEIGLLLIVFVGGEQRSDDGEERDERDADEADDRHLVFLEASPRIFPIGERSADLFLVGLAIAVDEFEIMRLEGHVIHSSFQDGCADR
jgi:hypothetical protein